MTNREWLNSLLNEAFIRWIFTERTCAFDLKACREAVFDEECSPCLHEVVMGWTSATKRLEQWLEEERK